MSKHNISVADIISVSTRILNNSHYFWLPRTSKFNAGRSSTGCNFSLRYLYQTQVSTFFAERRFTAFVSAGYVLMASDCRRRHHFTQHQLECAFYVLSFYFVCDFRYDIPDNVRNICCYSVECSCRKKNITRFSIDEFNQVPNSLNIKCNLHPGLISNHSTTLDYCFLYLYAVNYSLRSDSLWSDWFLITFNVRQFI